MKLKLENIYGQNFYDLYPMIGYFYDNENKGSMQLEGIDNGEGPNLSQGKIYNIIYKYLKTITEGKAIEQENSHLFNILMFNYAKWLKFMSPETYNFKLEEFLPNFYLLNEMK